MASKTCVHPYKVQGYIFKPIGSTSSKSPSLFRDLDKLVGAQAPLLGPSNVSAVSPKPFDILTTTFTGAGAPLKVYSNEKMKEIICTVMETRPATTEDLWEHFFKACLLDAYWGDNYIACYNFCQQCEDQFATVEVKRPNCILFATFFLQDRINFCWQQHKQKLDNKTLVLPI